MPRNVALRELRSDDVEDLVTPQFDVARMSVRVPFLDGAYFAPYIDEILPMAREILGDDAEVELTGMFRLFGNTIHAALDTMLRSYSTALAVITVLDDRADRQPADGLALDGPQSDSGGVHPGADGLGRYSARHVHIDGRDHRDRARGRRHDPFHAQLPPRLRRLGDVEAAVSSTLRGTGQALLFTSCVLAFGFLVYTQAFMLHLFNFGLIAASAIAVAFLADLTLAPALVATVMKPETPSGRD